jgi:hypothetical protein
MLRIPHCLDNRLIDGGKVVSLMHPPHFTPQKHYYFKEVLRRSNYLLSFHFIIGTTQTIEEAVHPKEKKCIDRHGKVFTEPFPSNSHRF